MGRLLDGVTDCTHRNWRLILFWLNGSEASKAGSMPFNIDKDPTTIKRYKEYWQRFICYCSRVLEEEEECGIQFLTNQKEILNKLWEMAETKEVNEDVMDSMVLKVSALFIMHSDYAQQKSALVHFFGILGYDVRTKRWRQPNVHSDPSGYTILHACVDIEICIAIG